MHKKFVVSSIVAGLLLAASTLALAGPVGAATPKGSLFFNNEVVHTVVVPAAIPHGGTDAFYEIQGGATGQLGVTSVAPGSPDYHGGNWAVSVVTWNVTPYLLTSQAAVLSAQVKGDVTVTRDANADFRCPVQP
jgi:hypothetical protein